MRGDEARLGDELEAQLVASRDALATLVGAGAGVLAGGFAVGHDLPAVVLEELLSGFRIELVDAALGGAGLLGGHRDGATGRGSGAGPDLLRQGRLVDELLHRLADVLLVDELRAGGLGSKVQGQVGDGVAGPQEDVVALVLDGLALVVLRGRDVTEVDGTRTHGVELGVVTCECLVDQRVDLGLVLAPVVLVGDECQALVGGEFLELPGAVHRLPQRVGGVGGQVLGLALQVAEDGLRALGGAIEVGDGLVGAALVPGVLGEQSDLVDLVVNEPGRGELGLGGDGEGVLVDDLQVGTIGEEALLVGGPFVLVVGDEVPPELNVAGGDGRAVGPLGVVAQLDGVGQAVLRDLGNGAQGLGEVDLVGGIRGGLVGEERAVHRLDELAVLALRVALCRDREDPVGGTRGHRDLVLSGFRVGCLAAAATAAAAATGGQAQGGDHCEGRAGDHPPLLSKVHDCSKSTLIGDTDGR